ncbi:MAG TPA: hypothetical protein VGA53_00675 [Candidatus Paceibacterota bacterium]
MFKISKVTFSLVFLAILISAPIAALQAQEAVETDPVVVEFHETEQATQAGGTFNFLITLAVVFLPYIVIIGLPIAAIVIIFIVWKKKKHKRYEQ